MNTDTLSIRTFTLRNLVDVYRLQSRGVHMVLEDHLVGGYAPLRQAIRAWLRNDTRTYLGYTRQGRTYLLQTVRRRERPEWDVAFAASRVVGGEEVFAHWRELIRFAVADAMHQGVYRLYAAPPHDCALLDVLQQEGFRLYCKETVYRLPPSFPGDVHLPGIVRSRTGADEWEFRRLWRRVIPQVVLAAEGLAVTNGSDMPYGWMPRVDRQVFVWEWEGELRGAVAVRTGRRGRWVRYLLAPEVRDEADAFVAYGLHLATRTDRKRPLYVAVPEYQGGIREPLHRRGARPFTESLWLVRHLAVPLRADEPALQPAASLLEVRGKPAFTRFQNQEDMG